MKELKLDLKSPKIAKTNFCTQLLKERVTTITCLTMNRQIDSSIPGNVSPPNCTNGNSAWSVKLIPAPFLPNRERSPHVMELIQCAELIGRIFLVYRII